MFICGMHRSGTSALARVCNLFGAELGSGLSGDGPDNPKGFWENKAVLQLNQQLCSQLGLRWFSALSPVDKWWTQDWVSSYHRRACDILSNEFGPAPLIAIKDPRISRLLPFWLGAAQTSSIKPHVIVAVRHPSEVAESLAKRNNLTRAHSYVLWLWHTLEAIAAAPRARSCLVHYDALLADPGHTMKCVAKTIGIEWPADYRFAESQSANFLESGLRHHIANAIVPTFWKPLDQVVESVYASIKADPVMSLADVSIDSSNLEIARLISLLGGLEVSQSAKQIPSLPLSTQKGIGT